MSIEELVGQFVNVVVGKDGKVASKVLKVCKANTRSVLFIEVDKENRKNIFRKISVNDIAFRGIVDSPHVKPELTSIFLKEGILPTKWESEWDSIGKNSPVTTHYIKHYNNRSNGWAHRLKSNSQFAVHNNVSSQNAKWALTPTKRLSTTNNSQSGFPMV